jgi:hypothetical protein
MKADNHHNCYIYLLQSKDYQCSPSILARVLFARMKPWNTSPAKIATLTANALDALGRTEEAKALRERRGLAGPQE